LTRQTLNLFYLNFWGKRKSGKGQKNGQEEGEAERVV